MDTQHFDINIHSPEENGEFVADFYPLRPTPERTLSANTALPPIKRIDVTDVYNEHVIDALQGQDQDPDDAWIGTDSDDIGALPAALHDLLAEAAEAIRTTAPDPSTRVERPAPVSTAFAQAGVRIVQDTIKTLRTKMHDFRLIEVLAEMDRTGADQVLFDIDQYTKDVEQSPYGYLVRPAYLDHERQPDLLIHRLMERVPLTYLLNLTNADEVRIGGNVTLTRERLLAHLDQSFPNKEYLA